ncbi:hypothetical protein [Sphingomonas morindae]|uniref:Uncharacterized protein n=1 Tax=Sphingomonas morindae TaxID=1541170 RepID=A0ABY4X950_9SPHN|nr:hypothetical protein [Sphingomonas morindae]USI73221.1 hypothetical protein LHA26_01715 [Sphingomonas morindae]
MHEKGFASLSGSLLARKGAARPALRVALSALGPVDADAPDAPEPAAAPRLVVRLPATAADEGDAMGSAAGVPEPLSASECVPARPRKAFTLRLDAARHARLRLVCAAEHRSAQSFLVEALDAAIAARPDLAALAGALEREA